MNILNLYRGITSNVTAVDFDNNIFSVCSDRFTKNKKNCNKKLSRYSYKKSCLRKYQKK